MPCRVVLGFLGWNNDFGGSEMLASPCDACQLRSSVDSVASNSLSIKTCQQMNISTVNAYQMRPEECLAVGSAPEVQCKDLQRRQQDPNFWDAGRRGVIELESSW